MRAGIHDTVLIIHVRQECVCKSLSAGFICIKCKLQYLHTRETTSVTQCLYTFRDDAQVFRDNRNITKRLFNCIKKIHVWSRNPFAIYCSRLAVWNGPVRFKAAEMIYAHIVYKSKHSLYAVNPPEVACLFHRVPVIQRVAPQLTCRTKVIRRNTGTA